MFLETKARSERINSSHTVSRWQGHGELYGAESPAAYPRGKSVQKTRLFWRNLNELSDKFSFDSESALVFEI